MKKLYCSPKKYYLFIATSALLTYSHIINARQFQVYAFIPWRYHIENDKTVQNNLEAHLRRNGLRSVRVIYDFMTDNQVHPAKVKKAALQAKYPDDIISFDYELNNRFKPETVLPDVLKIISLYREYNQVHRVGVYALAPQNTYGWRDDIQKYTTLNAKYNNLALVVDYLSPSLYNYDGNNLESWKKSATYNFKEARKFKPFKPIIPYITPHIIVGKPNKTDNTIQVVELSEEAMAERLQYLYDNYATGAIIWTSSQARINGKQPVFDASKGWGKAVFDFVKKYNTQDKQCLK